MNSTIYWTVNDKKFYTLENSFCTISTFFKKSSYTAKLSNITNFYFAPSASGQSFTIFIFNAYDRLSDRGQRFKLMNLFLFFLICSIYKVYIYNLHINV